MPDAVTLAPGSPRSDARCCDAGSGVVSPACLPVSARCCAPCPVSPSLRGQMPDAVPACLPVSPSLSDARCCNGRHVFVWPRVLCLPAVRLPLVSLFPDAVTLALGSCLPLVSLCLPLVWPISRALSSLKHVLLFSIKITPAETPNS